MANYSKFQVEYRYISTNKIPARIIRKIGIAISRWQCVEMALISLLVTIVHPSDIGPTASAFESLQHFSTKLKFLDRIFRHRLTDQRFLTKWEALAAKLASLNSLRNQLVHGVMIGIENTRTGNFQHIIVPSPFLTSNSRTNNHAIPFKDFLDEKDIGNMGRDFGLAYRQMNKFLNPLPRHLASIDKSHARIDAQLKRLAKDHPTIPRPITLFVPLRSFPQ